MSFCYFCQKKSVVGVVHNDLLFVQIGPQKTLFKRFYQLFSRTAGLQHKLLILISESPKIFHWKSVKKVKSLGQNLDQIRSNVINKQRNWYFNGVFFIFSIRYTFTSKIQWLQKYLSGKRRLNQLDAPCLKECLAIFGQKLGKVTI